MAYFLWRQKRVRVASILPNWNNFKAQDGNRACLVQVGFLLFHGEEAQRLEDIFVYLLTTGKSPVCVLELAITVMRAGSFLLLAEIRCRCSCWECQETWNLREHFGNTNMDMWSCQGYFSSLQEKKCWTEGSQSKKNICKI